jgi:hypothetical protein
LDALKALKKQVVQAKGGTHGQLSPVAETKASLTIPTQERPHHGKS